MIRAVLHLRLHTVTLHKSTEWWQDYTSPSQPVRRGGGLASAYGLSGTLCRSEEVFYRPTRLRAVAAMRGGAQPAGQSLTAVVRCDCRVPAAGARPYLYNRLSALSLHERSCSQRLRVLQSPRLSTLERPQINGPGAASSGREAAEPRGAGRMPTLGGPSDALRAAPLIRPWLGFDGFERMTKVRSCRQGRQAGRQGATARHLSVLVIAPAAVHPVPLTRPCVT